MTEEVIEGMEGIGKNVDRTVQAVATLVEMIVIVVSKIGFWLEKPLRGITNSPKKSEQLYLIEPAFWFQVHEEVVIEGHNKLKMESKVHLQVFFPKKSFSITNMGYNYCKVFISYCSIECKIQIKDEITLNKCLRKES